MTLKSPMKLIWDWPTRTFHWLLVLAILFQYASAEWFENSIQWHFYVGYFTLGLVLFRLLWGVWGTDYARFTQFIRSPRTVLTYIKHPWESAGHNPLGGWSVATMLFVIALQTVTGLCMSDDIFLEAPYYHVVSKEVQTIANWLHHRLFNVIIGLILLHIGALAYYRWVKRKHLVGAMFHGKKHTHEDGIPHSKTWKALFLVMLVALLVYLVVDVLPPAPPTDFY